MLTFLQFSGFLWPWKLTFIGHWITLMTYLSWFFNRCSIFTAIDEKTEKQKSTLQIFLKDVTEEKNVEIHKLHKHKWLSIIWIFKKLNSLKSIISQTTFKSKLPSEQNLQKITFDNWNSHCLEQICVSF